MHVQISKWNGIFRTIICIDSPGLPQKIPESMVFAQGSIVEGMCTSVQITADLSHPCYWKQTK